MSIIKGSIFFSYKSENVGIVRNVYERLSAQGIWVWMNEYRVKHDQQKNFQHLINTGIDSSEFGVLFVGKSYARSSYCHVEIERILRRIPHNKIVVIKLEHSEYFDKLYPEFVGKSYLCQGDENKVYQALSAAGVIPEGISATETVKSPESHLWFVKEAGFVFDNYKWAVDSSSRFDGLTDREKLKFSDSYKTEYHRFYREVNGYTVKLLLDYENYDEIQAGFLEERLSAEDRDKVLTADFEQDERQRLIDEMNRFPGEAANSYEQIRMANKWVGSQLNPPEWNISLVKEIGVHMLIMRDRKHLFRHRMFTFTIPKLNYIFRVYKLVLPHPQHKKPLRIRFIFCFNNNLEYFFRSVPYADELVASFAWINDKANEDTRISKSDLKKAMQRFGIGGRK